MLQAVIKKTHTIHDPGWVGQDGNIHTIMIMATMMEKWVKFSHYYYTPLLHRMRLSSETLSWLQKSLMIGLVKQVKKIYNA